MCEVPSCRSGEIPFPEFLMASDFRPRGFMRWLRAEPWRSRTFHANVPERVRFDPNVPDPRASDLNVPDVGMFRPNVPEPGGFGLLLSQSSATN